jgi:hypothetical protein
MCHMSKSTNSPLMSVPIIAVGASSNHACATYPTVAMVCDVKVPVVDMGTSSNHACPTEVMVR